MHEKLLFTLPLSIIIFTYTITIIYLCLYCAGLLNLVYSVCSGVSILLLDKENSEVKNSPFITQIEWVINLINELIEEKKIETDKINTIAKNLNMDDINHIAQYPKCIIKIIFLLFWKNPFGFIKKLSNYSWHIPQILEKRIFKNKPIARFFTRIMFNYVVPFSIVILIGYGISIYNNALSIFLSSFYILFVISSHVDKFNNSSFTFWSTATFDSPLSKYLTSLICLIISFASVYYNIYRINPNNFLCSNKHFGIVDSIYFSVVTFATVGYGEIIPNTNLTKILVCAEILVSIFVLIIIVSSYINRDNTKSKQAE